MGLSRAAQEAMKERQRQAQLAQYDPQWRAYEGHGRTVGGGKVKLRGTKTKTIGELRDDALRQGGVTVKPRRPSQSAKSPLRLLANGLSPLGGIVGLGLRTAKTVAQLASGTTPQPATQQAPAMTQTTAPGKLPTTTTPPAQTTSGMTQTTTPGKLPTNTTPTTVAPKPNPAAAPAVGGNVGAPVGSPQLPTSSSIGKNLLGLFK